MALTLITNPVVAANQKIFAGFQPVEFVFKREDLAITSVESGSGGIKINVTTDLTTSLVVGDSVYLYSEGADYTYDAVGTILSLTATDITIDLPFIQAATGGYINYRKNYYVELQCVDSFFPDSNLLPFSLQSDGDSAGNITIDVSIVNDLNTQRGDINNAFLSESCKEFEVQYKEVYDGSANPYTLLDNKLLIVVYATETPEENVILNSFDLPKIYLGYEAALVIAHSGSSSGQDIRMMYDELDINTNKIITYHLYTRDADDNGFLMFQWGGGRSVGSNTKYVDFYAEIIGLFDFKDGDFDYPDFVTQ
jgi:hypothetical protein